MMRKKHISIQVQKLFFERRLSNPFLQSVPAAKIRLESQTAGNLVIGQQPQMLQGESHHPAHERLYFLPDSQASEQVWPDTRASAFLETVDSNKNLFGLRIPRCFCQNFFRIAPQSNPFPIQPSFSPSQLLQSRPATWFDRSPSLLWLWAVFLHNCVPLLLSSAQLCV